MQQLASTKKNTKNTTIKSLFLALALALAWSTAISASPLTELKASGLIGERMDGYLGVVQTDAPKDVHAQVEEINTKRRAAYQRIATKNSLTLEDVAALAGKKTLQKTPTGQWVFTGTWRKK